MGNFFNLTLDTTGPGSPSISLDSGAYASAQLQNVTISCTGGDASQMKIWGDLDLTQAKADGLVGAGASTTAESDALWITYATAKTIKLSAGDGNKSVYCKIRDDVYNESSQASDSIILDTTLPVVNIVVNPDLTKISKVVGKNSMAFGWQSNEAYQAYEVRVVPASGSDHTAGVIVPTTAGSLNTSGASGSANATVTTTIKGADLETASSGDGTKVVKVFVQALDGSWSV